MKKAMEVL